MFANQTTTTIPRVLEYLKCHGEFYM